MGSHLLHTIYILDHECANFTHMHVDKEIHDQTLRGFSIGSGTTHGHAAFTYSHALTFFG